MAVTRQYITSVLLDDVSDHPPPLPPREPLGDIFSKEQHRNTKTNSSLPESDNLMSFSNADEDTNDFIGNFEIFTGNAFDSIVSESPLLNLSGNDTVEIRNKPYAGLDTMTYNLDKYFTGNLFKTSADLDSELKPRMYTPTFSTFNSDIDALQPAGGVNLPTFSGETLQNQRDMFGVLDPNSDLVNAPSQSAKQRLTDIKQEANQLDTSTTEAKSLVYVKHPKLSSQRSLSDGDIYNSVELGDNTVCQVTNDKLNVIKSDITGMTKSKSIDNINQRTKTDRISTTRHDQTDMKASSSFECITSTASKLWAKITRRNEDIDKITPQKLLIEVDARVELACPCDRPCECVKVLVAAQGGYLWASFVKCPWVSMYNNTHERVYTFDTRGCVDSLAVSATGVLYVSCPPQKRILMVSSNLKMTVLRSFAKSYPRGVAVSPDDGSLVVCTVPHVVGYVMKGPLKNSRLMRFKGKTPNETGTLVNKGDHFGYPVRLTINIEGLILVSDFGLRCLFVLDPGGHVLGRFSAIGGGLLWHVHTLTSNPVNSFFVVQGGSGTLSITRLGEKLGNFEENSTSTREEPLLIRKVATSSMTSDGQIFLASGNIITLVSLVCC